MFLRVAGVFGACEVKKKKTVALLFYLRHVIENHSTSFHEILYWPVVLEFNHFNNNNNIY